MISLLIRLLISLLVTFLTSSGAHVVLEETGIMAEAISYIRVALGKDLGQLDKHIIENSQGFLLHSSLINQSLHSQHYITSSYEMQIDS